jgi:hypothetical protein
MKTIAWLLPLLIGCNPITPAHEADVGSRIQASATDPRTISLQRILSTPTHDAPYRVGISARSLIQNDVPILGNDLDPTHLPTVTNGVFFPDLAARIRAKFLDGAALSPMLLQAVNQYLDTVLAIFSDPKYAHRSIPLQLRKLEFITRTFSLDDQYDFAEVVAAGTFRVAADLRPANKDHEFLVASLSPALALVRVTPMISLAGSIHSLVAGRELAANYLTWIAAGRTGPVPSSSAIQNHRLWLISVDGRYGLYPVCPPQINQNRCVDVAALIRSLEDPLSLFGACGPGDMVERGKRHFSSTTYGTYDGYGCAPPSGLCSQASTAANADEPVAMPNMNRSVYSDLIGGADPAAGLTRRDASTICTSTRGQGGAQAGFSEDCIASAISQIQQADFNATSGIGSCIADKLDLANPSPPLSEIIVNFRDQYGCAVTADPAPAGSSPPGGGATPPPAPAAPPALTPAQRAEVEQAKKDRALRQQDAGTALNEALQNAQTRAEVKEALDRNAAEEKEIQRRYEARIQEILNVPETRVREGNPPDMSKDTLEDFINTPGYWGAQEVDVLHEQAGVCNEQKQRIFTAASECFQDTVEQALRGAGVPVKSDYLPGPGGRPKVNPLVSYPVEATAGAEDPLAACLGSSNPASDGMSTAAGGCGLMLCPLDDPDCCHTTLGVTQSHLAELQLTLGCMDVFCAPDVPCPCLGEEPGPAPEHPPGGGDGDPPL